MLVVFKVDFATFVLKRLAGYVAYINARAIQNKAGHNNVEQEKTNPVVQECNYSEPVVSNCQLTVFNADSSSRWV